MTKQEKLAVKSSLLSIKDSLFRDAWEDIVSDHPYVEQLDDDIEDDVLVADAQETPSWEVGKRKMLERLENIPDHRQLCVDVEYIGDTFGAGRIQLLMGCALGTESHLGLLFESRNTFAYVDINYTRIVTTNDEDEAAYLIRLGYKRMSDINTITNN
jgi:hypothetical protein